MENEFVIDFSKLKIADSEYDREGKAFYYTAQLEPMFEFFDLEDTMRFQYEVMKRAGIEDDLQDAGIEVNDFEQFKQLYNDDTVMLKIEMSYVDNNGNEGIVANALYGESSTHFTEVPLNATEKASLEQFTGTILSEDKAKVAFDYNADNEILTKKEIIDLIAKSFSNNAFSSEKAYLKLIGNVKNAQTKHDPNYEQISENALEKAKELINDFCVDEYGEGADFTDLHDVGIAYTTYTDDEKEFQVTADLIDCKIIYEYDGETVKTEQYDDINDMVQNGLTGLDYDELVSLPDNISDKVYIQEAADRFKKDTDSLINTVHDFYDKVYEGEKSISKEDVAAALTDPAKASELATQLQTDIEGVGVDTAYFGFSSDAALGAVKALEDIAKGLENKDKAFIVELDDSGNYERFALTESDFKSEYPDTDIDRMRGGDSDTLKPFTHIWAKEVTIGDDDWKAHFTDMEHGLPDSDIEDGNLAYVNYFKCSSILEEPVRETAFHLDFSAITIEDSSFDRDSGGTSVYTAILADNYYDQEVSDRFQFELMRRSGLELDLLDDGIEVKNFEDFKELRKPEELGLKIELLYSEYGEEETVSARALYGSQSTRSEELVLTPRERESLDRFYDSDITPDKKEVQQEYDKEIGE